MVYIDNILDLKGRKNITKEEENIKITGQRWQSSMREHYKNNIYIKQRNIDILNNIEGWAWIQDDTFGDQLENWINQTDQVKAKNWQSTIRSKYKKGKLSEEQIGILNNTEGWVWNKYLKKNK